MVEVDNFSEKIEEVAKECGVVLPDKVVYNYTLHICYKCGKQMPVFNWGDTGMWKKEEPPKPIPKTVQCRYTETTGNSYWVNVCPFCDNLQGDWYLYRKPGGAFSGIPDHDYFYVELKKQSAEKTEEKEPEQQNLF